MIPRTANCVDCDKPITANTKTGRCRVCKNKYLCSNPDFIAARSEGLRRKWQDPEFSAKMRRVFHFVGRANGTDPERRARLVEHGRNMAPNLFRPDAVAKRKARSKDVAAKLVEHYMGWCPVEYRAEYKRLTESKRMLAKEARAIILAQIKADEASLSPFERQERALAKGAKLVANDRAPMFGEALRNAG